MQTNHTTTTDLLALIRAQEARIAAYGRSHLGILSGPAVRYELAQLTKPVDLIAFDWRKLHEWNDIMGRGPANVVFGRFACVDYAGPDRRHTPRTLDLRGQWDGDEILIAVDAGCGVGLFARILRELVMMNREMQSSHRADIMRRTHGLIDGFCVAAVLVECSTSPLRDAERAVDATGVLKAGAVTGSRATSGARGNVIGRLTA